MASAGFGVDGAATCLGPAGADVTAAPVDASRTAPRPEAIAFGRGDWFALWEWSHLRPRRLWSATRLHAAAFRRPGWRSALNLAMCQRLVVGDGAVCSLTRVPGRLTLWLYLAAVVPLVVAPSIVQTAVSDSSIGVVPAIALNATALAVIVARWWQCFEDS